MLRITKLTDYGILLLTALVELPEGMQVSARDIASESYLPLPTVAKILRILTKAGLLTSQRGPAGGYRLARDPSEISVADIITAFEGPIALTECLSADGPECEVEPICATRSNWDRISRAIGAALRDIPLSDMALPQTGWRQRIGASLGAADEAPTSKEGSPS